MKAVIIDDEKKGRETLRGFIDVYCPDLSIIGEAANVKEGIALIKDTRPDVIFLDIEMPDGTGFDLLSAFPSVDFQVVFVTAFDSYAVKAFQFSAVDYLLKPVNPKLLIQAVEKLKKYSTIDSINLKLDVLLGNRTKIDSIALPTAEGVHLTRIDQITRCVADNYYTTFHLVDDTQIIVSKTLKEYSDLLDDFNFYRVHQSHLVNLDYVDKYISGEGGYLIMKNGDYVDVSRRKKKSLMERMMIS
jgi:two-component system LytT family response regulator